MISHQRIIAAAALKRNLNMDNALQPWQDKLRPKETKREIVAAIRGDWNYSNLSRETYVAMNRVSPLTRYVQRRRDSESETARPECQRAVLMPTERQNSMAASNVTCDTTAEYAPQSSRYEDLCYGEMAVNPGLHHFIHRRDAWTAAVARPCPCSKHPGGILCWSDSTTDPTCPYFIPLKGDYPPMGHPLHEDCKSKASFLCATSDIYALVPIAPPIISSEHPFRKLINPGNYESLYRDFVAQGKNPKVPINLADLTRAIVVGLRASGEWPPKEGVVAAGDKTVGRPGTWRSNYRKLSR